MKGQQPLMSSARIVFLAGRVKFEPGINSAPFPSAIVRLAPCEVVTVRFEDWRPV